MRRCIKLALLLLVGMSCAARAQLPSYTWTAIIPQDDTRPVDERKYDYDMSELAIANMSATEKVFHQRLSWKQIPILRLLTASAPFCELDFDPIHQPVLTPREKLIIKEYLKRGGFVSLNEDVYPYTQEEIATVTKWPIVDFMTKELAREDPNFIVQKIDDRHPIYHQYYSTTVPTPERWALAQFPTLPDCTLVTYKGHPCVFVYANYFCDGEKWCALPRPFAEDTDWIAEDYAMNVNLYIYTSMH